MAGGPENAGRKANNHTAGGLRRGQPLHSEVPTSSIPTSRVAVLRAEAPSKDREAFNSRTERSLSLTANEIAEYPSPTMYSPVPSRFERQASASFSERGYGAGFASKTSRFARRRGGRAPGSHNRDLSTALFHDRATAHCFRLRKWLKGNMFFFLRIAFSRSW